MKFFKFLAVLVVLGLLVSAAAICGEQDEAKPAEKKSAEKVYSYVGLKKCKPCHIKNQYKVWNAAPHSKAYEELASEEALAVAKKLGLKEEPQKSAECLSCHVTAYGVADSLKTKITLEEGVSCEACHGPGSDYWSMKVMKALSAGKQDPAAVGLWAQTEEMCITCHNKKSPTYKPFKFEEALKVIAHPYPKKEEGGK